MRRESAVVALAVDVQADFTQYRDGTLAVPRTDKGYVDEVIARTRQYKEAGISVVATRDHHPENHISFYTNHPGSKVGDVIRVHGREQILWPPHCVQGTPGAEILIPADLITSCISKGERSDFDSYSGFRDDGGLDTGLNKVLGALGAKGLIIYGLATDVCVRATAIDALKEGYPVTLVLPLSRGVFPENTRAAIEEVRSAGGVIEE